MARLTGSIEAMRCLSQTSVGSNYPNRARHYSKRVNWKGLGAVFFHRLEYHVDSASHHESV